MPVLLGAAVLLLSALEAVPVSTNHLATTDATGIRCLFLLSCLLPP